MRVLFPDPLSPMRRCTPEWVKDTLTLLIPWTKALPDVNVLDSDFPLIVGTHMVLGLCMVGRL